jgi:hypothetical protein
MYQAVKIVYDQGTKVNQNGIRKGLVNRTRREQTNPEGDTIITGNHLAHEGYATYQPAKPGHNVHLCDE